MPTHYPGTTAEREALNAFIKLLRAADSVAARTQCHYPEWGLSPSQFGVLETLLHRGPLHQNQLGQKLLKSSGNITVVIDHLEQRQLVQRVRDTADRRHITVHLTPQGRQLIAGIFPQQAQVITREMGVLSAAELKQLAQLCKKLGLGSAHSGSPATAPSLSKRKASL